MCFSGSNSILTSCAIVTALLRLLLASPLEASRDPLSNRLTKAPIGNPFSSSGNSSSYDIFPATLSADPVCDGDRYGQNLGIIACEDALQGISSSQLTFIVSKRSKHGRAFLFLPYRWSSCKLNSPLTISAAINNDHVFASLNVRL